MHFLRMVTSLWPLLLAGYVQALALAWPFEGVIKGDAQGGLQLASLLVFAFYLERTQTIADAFLKAWVFSLAWLIGSMWWLFISMNTFGGMPAPLAALAVFLLAAGLALFYAIACSIYRAIRPQTGGVLAKALAFASLWMLAEIVRGTLWTGLPWGAIGYSHVDSVLRHWAPWVGVYGLCAISAGLVMSIAAVRNLQTGKQHKTWAFIATIAIAMTFTWAISPSQSSAILKLSDAPLRVTLLQGNIPQDLKFGEGVRLALIGYRDALLNSQSDLVVTPETAIPLIPEQLPQGYWRQLEQHFSKGQHAALIGLPLVTKNEQGKPQFSNSVIGLAPQPTQSNHSDATPYYQYSKHHLVPFGEFVPPMFQWFVNLMDIPLGDFSRGEVVQPSLLWKGERIAPNICYEDLFGEELARGFSDPQTAPTMMVNLSNIAWFGNTVAIDQHLHISRMRALEMGRPMLRATNTGATAVINAKGEVTDRLPSAVEGALTADVHGVHGTTTPYAQWVSRWGLLPMMAIAMLVVIVVASMAHSARHGRRRFAP